MLNPTTQLHASWLTHLSDEFNQAYMQRLSLFLEDEVAKNKTIYPATENIFSAFNTTTLDKVKVVILGQDPYHGPEQAHGLSFSVPKTVKVPPSLKNIYKEISEDLGNSIPGHGNLEQWAEQGVLLLNSVLTVESGLAASHQGKGWEQFTDKVISVINQNCEHIVFLLWGSYAQKKGVAINEGKHKVLRSSHPSPLSSYRGFFGCKHFSQTNQYLLENNIKPINWSLS